jgi:hypothetical protein
MGGTFPNWSTGIMNAQPTVSLIICTRDGAKRLEACLAAVSFARFLLMNASASWASRILLHDPRDYPLTINESIEIVRFAAGSVVPCAAVQGANMAFRRAALVASSPACPGVRSGSLSAPDYRSC